MIGLTHFPISLQNAVKVNYLKKYILKASLLANSGSFIDIKPFVNFTLNALGVFDDVNEEEPFDPKDSKRIFHSMFQIWNPKVGIRNDVFR